MSLPKSIQVGPYTIQVVSDQAKHDRVCRENSVNYAGRTSLSEQIIHLDPDMASTYTATTLIHEVLHSLLIHNSSLFNDADQEEAIVDHLAPFLLDTLRRNPTLVTYLLEDIQEGVPF